MQHVHVHTHTHTYILMQHIAIHFVRTVSPTLPPSFCLSFSRSHDHFSEYQVLTPSGCSWTRCRATWRLRDSLNEQRLYYVFSFSFSFSSPSLSPFSSLSYHVHAEIPPCRSTNKTTSPPHAHFSLRFARIILSPSVELR